MCRCRRKRCEDEGAGGNSVDWFEMERGTSEGLSSTKGGIQNERVGNGKEKKERGSGWCLTFGPFFSSLLPTFIPLGALLLISHSLSETHMRSFLHLSAVTFASDFQCYENNKFFFSAIKATSGFGYNVNAPGP